jgi:hypothetical protein
MLVDLSGYSVEAITAFAFDRPLPPSEGEKQWYFADELYLEITIPGAEAIAYLTALFSSAPELLAPFSDAQVEQGFFFLVGPFGRYEFLEPLWDSSVTWTARRACIAATEPLFANLFEQRELPAIRWMFWDCLAYDYDGGPRIPVVDAEDARVQDAMYEVLVRLLERSDSETQRSALHGLAHLRHSGGPGTMERIAEEGHREEDIRGYARDIRAGKYL